MEEIKEKLEKKFINNNEAAVLVSSLGEEFALVKNPDYIFPPFEIYPLARKLTGVDDLKAIVMDMDGTITTTELLCLHSLEYMIRKMSGRMSKEEWSGFNEQDFSNIIGNSTTKHAEYLINKYSHMFNEDNCRSSFLKSALWTITEGRDNKRKEEVLNNLSFFGLTADELQGYDEKRDKKEISINNFAGYVRAGIDIYYQRYHEILEQLKEGRGSEISQALFGTPDKHLIEPMPGLLPFLCLIKGWIDESNIGFYDGLAEQFYPNDDTKQNEAKKQIAELAEHFRISPLKTAMVTSSIFYEADIVLYELFKVLSVQIEKLNIDDKLKSELRVKFSDYRRLFDTVVTASDSSEIRLKPHRDLYSIALHQLHIAKADFDKVAGFEDSESGTTAIRAAGIGMCAAVPFAETSGHNLKAASVICTGGLPEAIIRYNLFIKR